MRRACEGELRAIDAAAAIGATPAAAAASASSSSSLPASAGASAPASVAASSLVEAVSLAGAPASAARWRPVSVADVRVARGLCEEYGVVMALAETRGQAPGRPCLWVDPSGLDALQRLEDAPPLPPAASLTSASRWRAGPGVTMARLAEAGLAQFAGLPGEMMVAAWLAGRRHMNGTPGLACPPGLVSVDVMLADGALETLGPFGASGGLPLRSATGQALIPALYMLSGRPGAAWCRGQAAWPARYRLDALNPLPPAEANLAGLLAGHEGALAWIESVVLQAAPAAGSGQVQATPYPAEARALDAHIKDAFDPAGLYPEAPLP
ncbi:hypothetical protein [Achromobacter aloeverae]